jgi:ribosomal protein S18 acetylase RimI-like enzyme
MPLVSLSKLTEPDLQEVRRRLAFHPLLTLYFEAAVDAVAKGESNRGLLIGGAGGVVLSIDFAGLTVRTTVGKLTESELTDGVLSNRPAELHLEDGHLEFARRLLGARIIAEKRLRYYRLDSPSTFAFDQRCRLLTRKDEQIVESFYGKFYPGTVFSPWMLDNPFVGLFDDGQLRSCGGVIVQSHATGIANLGNFLTHPMWRGLGFAKSVAKSLVGKLEEAGFRTFLLATTDDNIPARRVYEAIGFGAFEERAQLNVNEAPPLFSDQLSKSS